MAAVAPAAPAARLLLKRCARGHGARMEGNWERAPRPQAIFELSHPRPPDRLWLVAAKGVPCLPVLVSPLTPPFRGAPSR